jgi:hypothetical protein
MEMRIIWNDSTNKWDVEARVDDRVELLEVTHLDDLRVELERRDWVIIEEGYSEADQMRRLLVSNATHAIEETYDIRPSGRGYDCVDLDVADMDNQLLTDYMNDHGVQTELIAEIGPAGGNRLVRFFHNRDVLIEMIAIFWGIG